MELYLAISVVLVLLKEQYLADWYMLQSLHIQLMNPAALNLFTTVFSREGTPDTVLSRAKYRNIALQLCWKVRGGRR